MKEVALLPNNQLPHLQNLLLSVFEVELLIEKEAIFPPFKGSMFRGGLAWGIRKAACTKKLKSCTECSRFEDCAYSYLFESGFREKSKVREIPRPYLVQLLDGGKTNYLAGETLKFRIVLFGEAIKMLPFILLGLKHFASLGLGARRIPFSLQQVVVLNLLTGEKLPVYLPPDRYFDNNLAFNGAQLLKNAFPGTNNFHFQKIELEFLTPTRLAEKGKLIDKPSMETIARAALRRLSSLMRYYCGKEMAVDFKALISTAKQFELISDDLKWFELKRYSNRREKHLYISGFLGKAEYYGDLKELFPYLYLAGFCHLGKGTVYGLGAYKLKLVL